MKTTVISTDGSSVISSLNLKYISFDFSAITTITYTPRVILKCADYFNKHGKYPTSIGIIVYNGTNVTVGTEGTTGLKLISTEIIGDDTVRKYNFDADAYVSSDYSPVTFIKPLYFRGGTTKVLIEDVGITATFNIESSDGRCELDYNYYTHFAKNVAIISQPVDTASATIYPASMFRSQMPYYVYIDVRYTNVSMTKEQFLEILRCCSGVNFSTFKFLNGQPSPEEVIANINVNYPTSRGDGSTGVWLGFIHAPYSSLEEEEVAELFKERGVRNFYCCLNYVSTREESVFIIYFDNNGDYTITPV